MRHAKRDRQIVIGVADWHIVRRDRPDVSITSEDILSGSIAQKADIAFLRLIYGEVKQVDGIIAFGLFSEVEVDFLRSLSTEILFVNSDKKDYEFDQIIMDYEQGLNDMVHYLMDEKEYRSIGYIGGIYEDDMVRIGVRRLNGLKQILQKKTVIGKTILRLERSVMKMGIHSQRKCFDEGCAGSSYFRKR